MALHRLLGMRIGVPAPQAMADFYAEVGLGIDAAGRTVTSDAGAQITIEERPFRQLLEVQVGVEDERDLDTVAARLRALGVTAAHDGSTVRATDPATEVTVHVAVAPRLPVATAHTVEPNAPGTTIRHNRRAPAVFAGPRPPRRLGHVVVGSPDITATRSFLVDGIGFKVSDEFPDVISFLRCSTDHHNVAVVGSPVPMLQHYSWECDDVDHVGHTATALLRTDATRQAWGLGRHFIGSNFYWYLRDPSGSFLELYSDMDVIDDDTDWEQSGRTEVGFEHVANSWGPEIPLEFIVPADLPELEAGWAQR
jgi:catechol 2,3-dioxygenase-like lactoylglutathione lyase family enzyme